MAIQRFGGFPKLGGTFVGGPHNKVYWGRVWGPLFWETTISPEWVPKKKEPPFGWVPMPLSIGASKGRNLNPKPYNPKSPVVGG